MSSMSERFYMFAEQECSGSSPLYEHLAEQIAGDDDILQLAAQAPDGQPVPNLLFGAVHYLLMGERDHPLQAFYPTFTNHPKPKERRIPFSGVMYLRINRRFKSSCGKSVCRRMKCVAVPISIRFSVTLPSVRTVRSA